MFRSHDFIIMFFNYIRGDIISLQTEYTIKSLIWAERLRLRQEESVLVSGSQGKTSGKRDVKNGA